MSIWNSSPQRELTTNPLSGKLGADHAFTVGLTARLAGAGPAQAILTGAGAAGTVMAIFFAAISAYR